MDLLCLVKTSDYKTWKAFTHWMTYVFQLNATASAIEFYIQQANLR